MEKFTDLSKGYLPIIMVVAIVTSAIILSAKFTTLENNSSQNSIAISEINKKLEVLPQMQTNIALIMGQLGINKAVSVSK